MKKQYGIKCPSQKAAHKASKKKPSQESNLLRCLANYCADHPELDAYSAALEALCGPFDNLAPRRLEFNQ
jgi:hypothetical protein